MAQEEAIAREVTAGAWLTVGDAVIDTEAVTALRQRLVVESGRSVIVTDVHLFGTVVTVSAPIVPIREAMGRARNGPAHGPEYDPEVLADLVAIWRGSRETRRDLHDRYPGLGHRLDQLAAVEYEDDRAE